MEGGRGPRGRTNKVGQGTSQKSWLKVSRIMLLKLLSNYRNLGPTLSVSPVERELGSVVIKKTFGIHPYNLRKRQIEPSNHDSIRLFLKS